MCNCGGGDALRAEVVVFFPPSSRSEGMAHRIGLHLDQPGHDTGEDDYFDCIRSDLETLFSGATNALVAARPALIDITKFLHGYFGGLCYDTTLRDFRRDGQVPLDARVQEAATVKSAVATDGQKVKYWEQELAQLEHLDTSSMTKWGLLDYEETHRRLQSGLDAAKASFERMRLKETALSEGTITKFTSQLCQLADRSTDCFASFCSEPLELTALDEIEGICKAIA